MSYSFSIQTYWTSVRKSAEYFSICTGPNDNTITSANKIVQGVASMFYVKCQYEMIYVMEALVSWIKYNTIPNANDCI